MWLDEIEEDNAEGRAVADWMDETPKERMARVLRELAKRVRQAEWILMDEENRVTTSCLGTSQLITQFQDKLISDDAKELLKDEVK